MMQRIKELKAAIDLSYEVYLRSVTEYNDALQEIAERTPDKVKRVTVDIEADTRFYLIPSDMIKLLGVYRKYDSNDRYIPIPMMSDVEIQQDSSASTATTDDDVIII